MRISKQTIDAQTHTNAQKMLSIIFCFPSGSEIESPYKIIPKYTERVHNISFLLLLLLLLLVRCLIDNIILSCVNQRHRMKHMQLYCKQRQENDREKQKWEWSHSRLYNWPKNELYAERRKRQTSKYKLTETGLINTYHWECRHYCFFFFWAMQLDSPRIFLGSVCVCISNVYPFLSDYLSYT